MATTRVSAVVWLEAGDMPEALASALIRQGIDWELARGPFDALSRLLVGRGRRGRVLLIVEPRGVDRVEETRRTLERFDPLVSCWSYDPLASPKLAPMAALARPEAEVVVRSPRSGPPSLRLSGDAPEREARAEGEAAEDSESGPARPARSVLTPEELSMLLSEEGDG